MKERAIQLGVPAEDILTETHSFNTMENVIDSMKVIEQTIGLTSIRRILVVTTAFNIENLHALPYRIYLMCNQ